MNVERKLRKIEQNLNEQKSNNNNRKPKEHRN